MEAGPLGRSGYRLRSRKDEGSRSRGWREKWWRRRRDGSRGKKSFIKSNTLWNVPMVIRRGACINIREPCRKGHSITVPPTGVVLTGATQTHLIMLSASSLSARGREDGSLGKGAICGNCTDVPLSSDTILSASLGSVQAAAPWLYGISTMTPSQRLWGINTSLCAVLCFPISFWFRNHSHPQWHEYKGKAAGIFFAIFNMCLHTGSWKEMH